MQKALEGLSGLLGSDLCIRSSAKWEIQTIQRGTEIHLLRLKCCVAGDDVLMDSAVLFFKTLLPRVAMNTLILDSCQK